MKHLIATVLAACILSACAPTEPPLPPGVEHRPRTGDHWLFINYWAQWCKPCIEEIPELNEFAAEQAGKLIVYGVNYDQAAGEELLAQAAELNIEFPLLAADPAASLGYARPMVLPTTILVSPDGAIHARLLGPQTRESLLKAMEAAPQKLAPPVG